MTAFAEMKVVNKVKAWKQTNIFNDFMDLVVEYKAVSIVGDLEISTRTQHSELSAKENKWCFMLTGASFH